MIFTTLSGIPPYEYRLRLHIACALIAIYLWFRFLTTAYVIIFYDDDRIEVKSLLKKYILRPGDVESIDDDSLFLKLKTSKGKIWISTLMDDISGIKSTLRSFNEKAKYTDTLEADYNEKYEKK